jgi:signal transduction histidine kinase
MLLNKRTSKFFYLEKEFQDMDKLFDILPEGLVLINKELVIVLTNSSLERKLRFNRDEVLGQRFVNFLNGELNQLIPFINQSFKYQIVKENVLSIDSKKFKVTSIPIEIEEVEYCLLVFQDVSEMEEMEKKLIQNERLVSIGKLASGISHEINNPLDAAIRYINLALGYCNGENETLKDYLLSAREGLDRIANIINALREFSYHAKYNPQKLINIKTAVEGAISVLETRIKSKKIKLIKNYKRMLPFVIDGGLELVFTNLIKNSIDAINSHGIIDISVKCYDGKVEVRIKDNGSGIPKDIQNKIFDPFFTTKQIGKGTGLGLNICREIIEKSNGDIKLNSEVNKGTEVIITLPTNRG